MTDRSHEAQLKRVLDRLNQASANYTAILTLYSLYRLREEKELANSSLRPDLTSMIGALEARIFPECFQPNLSMTLALARGIIEKHDAQARSAT